MPSAKPRAARSQRPSMRVLMLKRPQKIRAAHQRRSMKTAFRLAMKPRLTPSPKSRPSVTAKRRNFKRRIGMNKRRNFKRRMGMKWRIVFASLSMLCLGTITAPAQAASQDECSIWLCLPGKFPGGCAAAHVAMAKRLKDLKPALPDFEECSASNPPQGSGSHMSYSMEPAALIAEHSECSSWMKMGKDSEMCTGWTIIPAHYVENTTCQQRTRDSEANPPNCTQTVQSIKVFVDGTQAGST